MSWMSEGGGVRPSPSDGSVSSEEREFISLAARTEAADEEAVGDNAERCATASCCGVQSGGVHALGGLPGSVVIARK